MSTDENQHTRRGLTGSGDWDCRKTSAREGKVFIGPAGGEGEEAWPVADDLLLDPGLILGHSRVHAWKLGLSAALSETDDPRLDPALVLLRNQRTSRIPL